MTSRLRRMWAGIAVVAAAGLWLRAATIASRGLWLDEFDTLVLARGGGLLGVWRACHAEARGAIYYLLVALATALFGESEWSMRLASVIPGALVPIVVFLALRRLGAREAIAAALLCATNHDLVWHSQSARSYGLGDLAAATALLALVRSVESGRALDRALLWGSVVLALDAHLTFAPLVPAVGLAALFAARRRSVYSTRKIWADALLATPGFLLPVAHAMRVDPKAFQWASGAEQASFLSILVEREEAWLVAGLGVAAVVRAVLRRKRPPRGRSPARAAALAFLAVALVSSAAEALALSLRGSGIVDARYLPVAILALQALVGAATAALLPRPLAALALVLLVAAQTRHEPGGIQEWREAQAQLARLGPAPSDPVLLWTGFLGADAVAIPGALSPVDRASLEAPIVVSPGKTDATLRVVLLTCRWPEPRSNLARYFEQELVPAIESSPRFFVVAHPAYAENLDAWLGRRMPNGFRRTFASRTFAAPVVVERYERVRPP